MFRFFSYCLPFKKKSDPTIVNLNSKKVLKEIEKELDVIVVSYGGSCSNTLTRMLENNKIRCRSKLWHKILCHSPFIPDVSVPIIYIFDNPVKAFRSMKTRGIGFWDVNQRKLSNNKYSDLSDLNLMKLMMTQFDRFVENPEKKKILMFPTHLLFKEEGKKKLEEFFGKEMNNFPAIFVPPKTSSSDVDFFLNFSDQIKKIKSY